MKNIRNQNWDVEYTTRDGIEHSYAPYYGEPSVNKDQQEEREYKVLSNSKMNEIAFKLKAMYQKAETEEEIKEVRNSYEFYQVMQPYYGHLGWDKNGKPRRNLVQSITEVMWHKVPDETVFSDQLWKNIEYAIKTYTGYDGSDPIDFTSFAYITAKRLKSKQENDAKSKEEKEDKKGDGIVARKRKHDYIEEMKRVDDEGNEEDFDMVDEREDILNELVDRESFGELVQSLVSSSRQKEKATFVLGHMASLLSRAEIARLLVDEFGGTFKTNEIFVDRLHKAAKKKVSKMGVKMNTTWNPNNAKTYAGMHREYKQQFYNKEAHDRNKYRLATYKKNTSPGAVTYERWSKAKVFEHVVLSLKLNRAQDCPCKHCVNRVKEAKQELKRIREAEMEG